MKTTTKTRKKRATKKRTAPATTHGWLTHEELEAFARLPKYDPKPPARRNPHPFADIGAL